MDQAIQSDFFLLQTAADDMEQVFVATRDNLYPLLVYSFSPGLD